MTKIVIGMTLVLFSIYSGIIKIPAFRDSLEDPSRRPAYVAGGVLVYVVAATVGVILMVKGRREKINEESSKK